MTDDVIALVNEKFVCYAPRYAGTGGKYAWWVELRRAKNAPKGIGIGEATIPGTMFWLGTAAGYRVPTRQAKYSRETGLVPTLKQVLQSYAELPEAERRPAKPIEDANLPEPAPPAGGLVLVSFDRPVMRNDKGEYRSLTGSKVNNYHKKHIPFQPGAQRDALWLTAEECRALMPKDPQKGQTFSVAPALTKRIGLYGLTVRSAWQEFYHWHPDSVRQGELKLTVASVSPTAVQMRIHGSILLSVERKHYPEGSSKPPKTVEERYDARLEGRLVYDPAQKRIARWDMIALGDYVGFSQAHTWPGPRDQEGWALAKEPVAIAMSFEIDGNNYEVPAEHRRSTPFLVWWLGNQALTGKQYYFNLDSWEADWRKQHKK